MNKISKAVTILMVLLLCLSFTVGAAQSGDTEIKTKEELVQDKIKEKDFVKYQQPHDKNKFDRDVAGPLYLKVQSTKNKVPDGFEVDEDGYQTMVSYKTNGKIFIRDTQHKVETVQVPWNEITSLRGWNGESVLIKHYNDYGMQDAVWVQHVYNNNGYAYLEELPFSEIIVSGFVGTYTKSDVNVTPSDAPSLGYTFDSDYVNYINLTVTDQYPTKTDPYDINTTGLAGWWKFDEGSGTNVSDSSGNGNHGTFAAANYTTGKYNDGGDFDGIDDFVNMGDISEYDFDNDFAIVGYFNTTASSGNIVSKFRAGTDGYSVNVISNKLKFFVGNGTTSDDLISTKNINTGQPIFFTAYRNDGIIHLKVLDESLTGDSAIIGNGSNTYEFRIGNRNYASSPSHFNGTVDEILLYNRSLSQEEFDKIHYIKTSQLKTRTNSNATYSDEWNSSSDNPLSVQFGAGESISSLRFDNYSSIVQNGITIYEPSNMLFNTSIEIGHLENTTNIYEEANGDSYQIFIQHVPGVNSTSGTVSFTSDANDILSSPYLTTGMETNNTNAVMSYNAATREWTVTTGAIVAGTSYNYVLFGVLEGEALEEIVEGGFGSDNMHAYEATANDTTIIGSAFRATYGDSVWGNQSNDLWSDLGPLFTLAALVLVIGVVVVSIRRFRE